MEIIRKKIALEGVRFFAYHGFYPQEQILGNEFFLDVETEMAISKDGNDVLADTVNYERLFEIASSEMQETRKLLETVAISILNRIREEFNEVDRIRVAIRKSRLPLNGEIRNSLVEFSYCR